MHSTGLLLRTKLAPPQRQRRVLPRPALLARLREALEVRLTLVQAGTGYSKTTALAALDTGELPALLVQHRRGGCRPATLPGLPDRRLPAAAARPLRAAAGPAARARREGSTPGLAARGARPSTR